MVRASVIVPARNAAGTLARTLDSLAVQELDGDYEVIVVDDGSTDGTAALAQAAPAPVRLIRQDPRGPAEARNRGVAAAAADLLAFCDADVYPRPDWLQRGVRALDQSDLVQGRVLPDPGARLGPFDRSIWVTHASGLYEAASLFVTRSAFERIGGFEEWIRPRGGGKALAEDVWFGVRARRAGLRTGFAGEALAHHAVLPRGPGGYVAERARLRFFPAMARKMPELRGGFLHRRYFLNPRTLRFDAAAGGLLVGVALRSPLPLAAAVPYVRTLLAASGRAAGDGRGTRPPERRLAVASADLAADALGLAALLGGSVRYRSLVA